LYSAHPTGGGGGGGGGKTAKVYDYCDVCFRRGIEYAREECT